MRIFAEHGGADGDSNGDTDSEPEASAAEDDGDARADSDSEDYAQADLHGWSLHCVLLSEYRLADLVFPLSFRRLLRNCFFRLEQWQLQ
jgi:hypothetical protein